ncbi:hypothetical protein COP2_019163 [Malus domestica]
MPNRYSHLNSGEIGAELAVALLTAKQSVCTNCFFSLIWQHFDVVLEPSRLSKLGQISPRAILRLEQIALICASFDNSHYIQR